MCGIAGLLDLTRGETGEALAATAGGMIATLAHRGPDDEGVWVDAQSGVALGHRRLSILDLSAAGHQPMVSTSGRYVLTYNGEIYNFKEIARELSARGHRFRGGSDTEVMLAAIEREGLERALERCNGMFAFALWDRQERKLHLGRDRLGEKPLYYGWVGHSFLFGSELKALRAHPGFRPTIDRGALLLYFRHNCIPAPYSIYSGISKLPPGTVLTLSGDASARGREVVTPYWSAQQVAEDGAREPFGASASELTDELDRLLTDAVGIRMHADVPLGAFLSGGIDSSLVVSLMQAQSGQRVKTFTIGLEDSAYDEAREAARVAHHLGTDHVEVQLTRQDALDVIPELPVLYDEPFGDSSQIPTFLVSQIARRDVKVSLSGDGGDELFAGYNRYSWTAPIWRASRWAPRPARRGMARAVTALSQETWDDLFRRLSVVLPPRLNVRIPGYKMHKLASVLPARSIEEIYLLLTSHWKQPELLVPGATSPPSLITDRQRWPNHSNPVERMMYLDLVTYLPDDILVKVDRATMGVSLEGRVPLLDPRVVEFAWRLPLSLKLNQGQGKWLLRKVLHRYVPPELVERPKMGFGLPVGQWLREGLRPWAEELLSETRLRRDGLLDPAPVRALWSRHVSGDGDHQYELWDVLMLQA